MNQFCCVPRQILKRKTPSRQTKFLCARGFVVQNPKFHSLFNLSLLTTIWLLNLVKCSVTVQLNNLTTIFFLAFLSGLASPRLLGYRGTTALLRYYRRGLKKKVPYRGNAVNKMPPRGPGIFGYNLPSSGQIFKTDGCFVKKSLFWRCR